MSRFKLVDKNTDSVVWAGEAKTSLELVKRFKLAYESQQHLKLVQTA